MFNKVGAQATANNLSLTGMSYATLTRADLDQIPNGGEMLKDVTNDVIRWYQGGLKIYGRLPTTVIE